MKNFSPVQFSLPPGVKKNRVILPEELLDYIYDNCRRSSRIFMRNFSSLLENMPDGLCGKMERGAKVVDYMPYEDFTIPGITAVISGRVKDIFDRLQVRHSEYILREISIEKHNDKYYLLFVPEIKDSEIVFPQSEFFIFNDLKTHVFKNFEDYEQARKKPVMMEPKVITLPARYEKYDLIKLDPSLQFFSPRLVREFRRDNIAGCKFLTPDDMYYEQLLFSTSDR